MVAFLQLAAEISSSGSLDPLGQLWQPFSQWIHSAAQPLIQSYHQISQAASHEFTPVVNEIASSSPWQAVLYWIVILVMLVGIAGAFIPAIPGISLIVGAIVVWGLIRGFTGLWIALGVAIAAFLLGVVADYLSGIIGAQRVGASSWGQIGAVLGMLLGLLGFLPALPIGGPIFGLIFGTVLGAFIGEFLHRRELPLGKRTQQSFKVGIAIVVGNLVGNLLQGLLALIAFVVFVVTTWPSVYGG
jgi:uncharacterized protein